MAQRKGRLIIISAPSGAGKTTVIDRYLATHEGLAYSISCTTRPKRGDEVNGKDYHFVDQPTFDTLKNDGKLAEWAYVHGHFYGTPKEPIDNWIDEGRDVMLDVDVIGGMKLKTVYGDKSISIFLLPPSEEELKRRLIGRGTDSPEQQALRLKNALIEMIYKDKYDHRVINDDLAKACKEIEEIITRS